MHTSHPTTQVFVLEGDSVNGVETARYCDGYEHIYAWNRPRAALPRRTKVWIWALAICLAGIFWAEVIFLTSH